MVFVGDPTPEDVAAVQAEARAMARDAGAVEAVRDGVSIARLVDVGDLDGASVIADQYVLTLEDLAVQLEPPDMLTRGGYAETAELLAIGYRIANLCNAGDHLAAQREAENVGTTLADVIAVLS